MNNVGLTGRITKEPELKTTPNNKYVMFTLAVDRGFKDNNGNYITDFISCVAWNNQADFINNYVQKGNLIELTGSIQTRSYQAPNGENKYITEVIVEKVKNLTPKPKEEIPAPDEPITYQKNFIDDDLPY